MRGTRGTTFIVVAVLLGFACAEVVCSDPHCEVVQDDLSLLALRAQQTGKPLGPGQQLQQLQQENEEEEAGQSGSDKPSRYQCPGSQDFCSGNQCCPGTAATDHKTFPCPDAERSYYQRCEVGGEGLLKALLSAMTRKEKYGFLRGVGWKNGTYETLPGYYIGNAGIGQRFGIPSLNMQDNGNGFRTVTKAIIDQVTSWPVALAVASSWSEKDGERWGRALGKEFHIKGANAILGPGVNVHRVARGGRNAEYISGESAYLGSRLVKPWVKGVQSERVLAVVKHYLDNNQEDHRDTVDAIVDERTEQEVYLPPFHAAIEAGVASAMCAYNLVNGEHACGNKNILQDVLRKQLGFKGWVMSDWWALHRFAALDGVDQEMPGDYSPAHRAWFTDENLDTLDEDQVDALVRPQFEMMINNGLFEPEGRVCEPLDCNASLYEAVATSPEHQELCKELATNAVMLLKNEKKNGKKVLPVDESVKNIALLGFACDAPQDVEAMLAQWDLGSYYNIGGSGRVIAQDPISIKAGLEAACKERGCNIVGDYSDDVDKAVDIGAKADMAFICGATTSTEGHDRKNLSVDQQDYMVQVARQLSKRKVPTVSLTMTPGTAIMPWAKDVHSILNIFIAGKYTGTAFADVIFGKSNPSSKSPVTFPLSEKQTIPPCEGTECPYKEGIFVGYKGLEDEEVLFPFGHGESYTQFKFSSLEVFVKENGTEMPDCFHDAVVGVRVKITNVGDRKGVEVPQLYLGFPAGSGEPKSRLRGFERLPELSPGAETVVNFPLTERDLQIYETCDNLGWTTPNGLFGIKVGSSSRDIRATAGFTACNGKVYSDLDMMC